MVMQVFSSSELAGMQATQESAMMDLCAILRMAETGTDKYGKMGRTWFARYTDVPCGFGYPKPRESLGLAQVPQLDAVLRLPLDTDITNLDRIKVTDRFGVEEADPITYELVGPIEQGPSGIRVGMKRVTNA